MVSKRVVIDLDGVLAEFNETFRNLLIYHGAAIKAFDPTCDPNCWNWTVPYGGEKKHDRAAWEHVGKYPSWWQGLKAHRDMNEYAIRALQKVYDRHEVTFVTSRPHGARQPSINWLKALMMIDHAPQVLVTPKDKGQALIAMQPEVIIEDKVETLESYGISVKELQLPACQLILVNRPYNRHLSPEGVTRVRTSEEALRLVADED